jgi:serine/threonine-protein kinase
MIGTALRQYVITSRLGEGGMGEVWLARDTTLDRDVALKILPGGQLDVAVRRERFYREAKAASALNHPNIITIYEINSDQGTDFIAMEYVRGSTLAAYMQSGGMPIETVEKFAAQNPEAVGRAHRAGIVHRDLKPGNIMVTEDGLVKVLDFGLAKVTAPSDPVATPGAKTEAALTRAGTSVGTLGYMSPEQAIGDSVDARSDVFSFGVILYEMLSGRLPFTGKTLSEVLRELHFTEPPRLEALRPEVPVHLREVVARALAKRPEDRFPNLTEVSIALGGGPSPSAATLSMPVPPGSASYHRSSRPTAWTLIAVAAAVVIAIAGVVTWQWRGAGPEPDRAAAAAGTDSSTPFEMTRAAAELLKRLDRVENADRAIALLDRAIAGDPSSAIAHAHLASAYVRKQQTNQDSKWMQLALDHAQRAIDLNPELAAAYSAMGFVRLESREHAAADTAFRRAAQLDPVNPFPHMGLALNFAAQSQDDAAEPEFRTAVQLGPQEWRTHQELAQFLFRKAGYKEAAAHWEQAQTLAPDHVALLRNLGAVYYMLDRHDEAASMMQRALEIRPEPATYNNLGTVRFFQGRYDAAVPVFEKAVELSGNNHAYWGNLADAYRWAPGRRAESTAAYRRASELIGPLVVKSPNDANLKSRHALYLIKLGEGAAAAKLVAGMADDPKLQAQILYRLTVIAELAGDRDRALSLLRRTLSAGYPAKEVAAEPELTELRTDSRYRRLMDEMSSTQR